MEFKRLSEVEAIDEVPEGAHVLGEVDGVVKRMPSKGLGGAVATAIIKMDGYDEGLNGRGAAPATSGPPEISGTFSCANMTFEEAHQALTSGEPLSCLLMIVMNGIAVHMYTLCLLFDNVAGLPCIALFYDAYEMGNGMVYWTADGLSTEAPSGDK